MKLNLINLLSKVRFESSSGSKMMSVGCQWVFANFIVGYNHSRPPAMGDMVFKTWGGKRFHLVLNFLLKTEI